MKAVIVAIAMVAPLALAEPIIVDGLQYVGRVAEDGYKQAMFFNLDSVKRHKEYVKVWTLMANADANNNVIDVDGVGYTRALYLINCRGRSLATKTVAYYTAADKLVGSTEQEYGEMKFTSAIPASIGEALLDAVCKRPTAPAR